MIQSPIQTREMAHSDVPRVTEIHRNAFAGFFLTSLGPRFLKVFYSAVIDDPTGISLLAYNDQDIFGFAVGTSRPKRFYRRLIIRRSLQFFWAALPSILASPRIVPHLIRGFFLPREAARPDGWGTLLSIGVAKEGQNLGIGHLLITSFLNEGKARGLRKINLLTDKEHNEKVNNFYLNNGFTVERSFKTHEGRWMNEYVIELPDLQSIGSAIENRQ